jgi:hypothetical protein
MTAAAVLEVWSEVELRQELLRIADSYPPGERETWYASAWSSISRSRAGGSAEFYLARVVTSCCRPRRARHG